MSFFKKDPTTWERKSGDIASRIVADDVKRIWFNRPFIVQEGTAALMFSKGQLLGSVGPGEHDIDGVLRRFFHGDDPTTLLIIDDGEMPLGTTIDGLYSNEQIGLSATVRLTIALAAPDLFYRNTMRDRRSYAIEDLTNHLQAELHDALLAFTSVHSIESLYNNPQLRAQAESAIQERIGTNLAALGFALVTVNVLSVTSDDFDRHRGRSAHISMYGKNADLEAVRLKVLQRAREFAAGDNKHKAVTDTVLRDAVNQAVHELGLKDQLRADELLKLQETLDQDMADFKMQREHARESTEVDHQIDLDSTSQEHKREQERLDLDSFLGNRIAESKASQAVRDEERSGEAKDFDLEAAKMDRVLDWSERHKKIKTDDLREKAEIFSQADTATKIALGAADADALLELDRIDQQGKMTPDQLLVIAAEKSTDVAAALAQKFIADGRMNDEMMDQLRRQLDSDRAMNREHAMQLERVLNTSLNNMGKVAAARSEAYGPGNQTIVTPGFGGPAVINPQVPPSTPGQPTPPAEQSSESDSSTKHNAE
jgi:hypothetical protein